MEPQQLGLAIGLSLGGFFIFLTTLTTIVILHRKKVLHNKKSKKHSTTDSKTAFAFESDHATNKATGNSKHEDARRVRQASNKLPRQPFEVINETEKNKNLEKEVEVKEMSKKPSKEISKKRQSREEKEWQSKVEDIFNSALSLHEFPQLK